MAGLLSLERREDVAVVTLQRPEKRNALSIDLRVELTEAFGALGDDPDVGAVVLTGAPPAFCSGMDTTQFGGDREHRERLVETSISCFRAVGELRQAGGRRGQRRRRSPAASPWPCSATCGSRPSRRASAFPSCRAGSLPATPPRAPPCRDPSPPSSR